MCEIDAFVKFNSKAPMIGKKKWDFGRNLLVGVFCIFNAG